MTMCGFCERDPLDVAINPFGRPDVDELLERADEARERAKEEA